MPLSMLGRGFSGLMYASEKVVRVVRSSQKPHWYPTPIQILWQWQHGYGGWSPCTRFSGYSKTQTSSLR